MNSQFYVNSMLPFVSYVILATRTPPNPHLLHALGIEQASVTIDVFVYLRTPFRFPAS
ncbi:hypothetical protein C0995_009957 [Termitomyces sp. Mi166|nr:hypothetical protein C0995_009957 [Termitomyces sp. Mi166\